MKKLLLLLLLPIFSFAQTRQSGGISFTPQWNYKISGSDTTWQFGNTLMSPQQFPFILTKWQSDQRYAPISGGGYVPNSRTLTINGVTYDLSANRTWTIIPDTSHTSTGVATWPYIQRFLTQAGAVGLYQPILVSGTNIKTVGGTTLLGSGDVPFPSLSGYKLISDTTASAGYVTNSGLRDNATPLYNKSLFSPQADYLLFTSGNILTAPTPSGSNVTFGKFASANFWGFKGSSGNIVTFSWGGLTAGRTITIPDVAGTLGYINAGQTFSSANMGTNIVYRTPTGTAGTDSIQVKCGSSGKGCAIVGNYYVPLNGAGGTPTSLTLTNGTGLPLTSGVTGILPSANGGTGVNNGSSTITLGGNLTTSGAFNTTLTSTATTSVTLPTSGTLYGTASGSITSAQLASSLTDETGSSGGFVRAGSPTLTGTATIPAITMSGALSGATTGGFSGIVTSGGGLVVSGNPGTPSGSNLLFGYFTGGDYAFVQSYSGTASAYKKLYLDGLETYWNANTGGAVLVGTATNDGSGAKFQTPSLSVSGITNLSGALVSTSSATFSGIGDFGGTAVNSGITARGGNSGFNGLRIANSAGVVHWFVGEQAGVSGGQGDLVFGDQVAGSNPLKIELATGKATFIGSINNTVLTASQLVATDASKNLVSVTALPNGTTATTQSASDNSVKVATTAYVDRVKPIHGNSTTTGTATTTVTVTIGSTMANTTYNTTITPRDLLTAVNYYISAQTTTTFDVTFVTALTGSINFDWSVTP